MLMTALQVLASAFALLGTWLLRKPGRWMPWGFACWLVSNPAAMLFLALHGHWVLFAQHLVFFVLALDGVWHWLVRPGIEHNLRGAP